MKNTTILIIFFILLSSNIFSQVTDKEKLADKETFDIYISKDWNKLIKIGEKYLSEGVDFYYLQYRIGIAYYNLKKYGKAVKYFEKVYKQTPKDDIVTEYLFYSYFFSGMYDDSRVLSYKMSDSLKEKLSIKGNNLAEFMSMQYIYEINEDYEEVASKTTFSQDVVTKQNTFNVSLKHNIKKRLSILHGYTQVNLTTKKTNNIGYYFQDTQQGEYFLKLNYHFARRSDFIIGFHILNTALSKQKTTEDAIPVYSRGTKSFAFSMAYNKRLPLGGFSLGSSVSNLNFKLQIQPALNIYLYPLGNSKFYTNTSFDFQIQKSLMSYGNGNKVAGNTDYGYIIKQSIGFSIAKYLWIAPFVSYGNIMDYTENFATSINNDSDLTKIKAGALLNFSYNHLGIFAEYDYKIKSNSYFSSGNFLDTDYINHTVTFGINWYF